MVSYYLAYFKNQYILKTVKAIKTWITKLTSSKNLLLLSLAILQYRYLQSLLLHTQAKIVAFSIFLHQTLKAMYILYGTSLWYLSGAWLQHAALLAICII